MAKTKQGGMNRMVMVMVMATLVAAGESYECKQMRGECRLKSSEEDNVVTRNISCYCEHDEDVSRALYQLSRVKCLEAGGKQVNTTILHINGCSVLSQVFPKTLLATSRASTHMVLYVKNSKYLSLPSLDHSTARPAPAPRTITATFIQSKVSGMPAQVVSGAGVRAVVKVEGGKMDVLESRSFSDYPNDAQVSVTFKNTDILTVKQGAFDLPPAAHIEVQGGQMLTIKTLSFSGGNQLTLSGVKVAKLLHAAINVYGLKKLSVTNCNIAAVYANALSHRPPTYIRTTTGGQEVLAGSEATFSGNNLTGGNGHAFLQLCTMERLLWHNNTMLSFSDMPLRLQGPRCRTKRNWTKVFSLNELSCLNCTDFSNPDQQSCGLYESGYCNSCDEAMDGCNTPVLPYLTAKCLASHPHIARDLNDTCDATATSNRNPKALLVQEQGVHGSASLTSLSTVVILAVAVLLVVAE